MITTLSGSNRYLIGNYLKDQIESFISINGDYSIEKFDGEEATFNEITEAFNNISFFVEQKMIILNSPSKNKQFFENFETLLNPKDDNLSVIIIEPQLDKRQKYYKYLKAKTTFLEYGDLTPDALYRWIVEYVHKNDATISLTDAHYLVDRVGMNQLKLSNELNKLILYSNKISVKTIDLLTEPLLQSTIFQLLESAFIDNRKTLELYEEQRAMKVDPSQIIAMLTWQLYNISIIKTAGDRSLDTIASESKINPYVLKKTISIARNLTRAELKEIIDSLLLIDLKSKSENIDLDEALKNYLLHLATK